MKRILTKSAMLCTLVFASVQADAQISLGNILKNVVSGDKKETTTTTEDDSKSGGILSALTSVFSNSKVATKDKIVGTWVYEEPAVVLSSENKLNNLGGKLASAAIENKLRTKLEGYGFKKGSVKMEFDSEGNFTQTFLGKNLKGTYTIEDKNMVLKYGGKVSQVIGTTQLDGNNLLIVMDVSKLLKYVNVLGDIAQNSVLGTATSFLDSMDGLECGLKLVKE